jgi:thiamine pyrophosphate-dependent acetolactate synthase large subunit-like protein
MKKPTNALDGGEAILEAFRRLGMDYILSSPGSEWSPVWEALARQKLDGAAGPRFVESWHEGVAVNMAAGYTLMTGRPQAVLLHAGVGLLQGAMAILGALQAEVPMVVMSGEAVSLGEDPDLPIEPQWYGGLTVGGPERLAEPYVKWSRQVASPFTLYESVIRAGEMAARVPAGPVYLNVPLEFMLHRWDKPELARTVPPAPKLRPDAGDIDRVAGLLRAARNPVIVAESAGRDPAAYEALVALAEQRAVPVANGNQAAFANFPTDHPLYLGYRDADALAESDLLLLVGCRAPWYPPRRRPGGGKIVAINDNPHKGHMIYQNLQAELYLEGDIATSLRLLGEATRPGAADAARVADRRERWAARHGKYVAGLRAAEKEARAAEGIDAVALCAALAEAMPADTIFVDETITHGPAVRQHLGYTRPQTYFRVFGGLGQALGTALGVKLAAPERPVVAVAGDGGFLYNPIVQALGAAKTHGLPILIVIFNNRGYQAMKTGHVHHYPKGVAVEFDQFYGFAIDGPDYAEFAKPFGFHGRRVTRLAEIATAVKEARAAMAEGRTAILNVALHD